MNYKIEFVRWSFRNFTIPSVIFNYFSLVIFVIVSESLQDILGSIGVPRYSPTRASTCFFNSGVNSTDVGEPIPKFSSKYLNYSGSLFPL
uniref:Uncharacterized protein n=1 Tax=Podoviridae sp. ct8Lf7 TaxID=2827723 RepID=A0A8S5S0R0_9CAUD|nr:MAG TPA: hypothetical protein [Podoviridae sp. ct8Lf7]